MFPSRRSTGVVVAVVVLSVLATPVASAPATPVDSGVLDTDVTGPGDADVENGIQFVWQSERTDIEARVGDYVNESDSYYEEYYVRVTAEPDARFDPNREDSLANERVTLGELEARNITLSIPKDELSTGQQTLYVSMYEPGLGPAERVNQTEVPMWVVTRQGDVDNDHLPNVEEVQWETELLDNDTDDDGLQDGYEVHVFDSNPLQRDSDNDGVFDSNEVRADSSPKADDTDRDGLSDEDEVGNLSFPDAEDSDLDALSDPAEEQLGTDPTDRDTDGDGLADGTEYHDVGSDPLTADTDGDGLSDSAEVGRFGTDPTAADTDGDGVPDGQEVLRGTDPTDSKDVTTDDATDGSVDDDTPEDNDADTTPNESYSIAGDDVARSIVSVIISVLGGLR